MEMALLDDIRNHLAVMNPGQRERRGAVLLREAAAEIERLSVITPSESDSPQPVASTPDAASTPGEGTRQSECPYVTGTVTRYCTLTPFTLTDKEREALKDCVHAYGLNDDDEECASIAATLRGLLERLG